MTDYTIREFRRGDREGYLELYETVFGARKSPEWFAWKYEDNPYADHVPVYVAETNGEIVGARSFFALRLRHGDTTVPVLQPCDTMVHPDHRRRGIFTRMTEAAIDRYAPEDPVLFFDFPNENSLPGNLKLGWRVVAEVPTYYRVQRPGALADLNDSLLQRLVDRAGDLAIGAYLGIRDRVGHGHSGDVAVDRHDTLPVATLLDINRQNVPDRFHAARDEEFYRWRFGNPDYDYSAYVARVDGEAVGAVVLGVREETDVAIFADVLPLTPAEESPEPVYAALVEAALDDVSETGLVAVREGVIPPKLLASYGFRRDADFPLSQFSGPITLVVRPLPDDAWSLAGHDLLDFDNWLLSFCDKDSA